MKKIILLLIAPLWLMANPCDLALEKISIMTQERFTNKDSTSNAFGFFSKCKYYNEQGNYTPEKFAKLLIEYSKYHMVILEDNKEECLNNIRENRFVRINDKKEYNCELGRYMVSWLNTISKYINKLDINHPLTKELLSMHKKLNQNSLSVIQKSYSPKYLIQEKINENLYIGLNDIDKLEKLYRKHPELDEFGQCKLAKITFTKGNFKEAYKLCSEKYKKPYCEHKLGRTITTKQDEEECEDLLAYEKSLEK
ncbi:hypothetical protein U5B43_07395 [Campylobacter sp. 9BO]|uniref:hypothetical protein n=1 Tax=Campylobacter sp. 9BO TaxID=3424759 RepID=UPI003D32C267